MNTTRRDFMKGVAAAAMACGAARPAFGGEPAAPGIIDTHQHVWDLKKLRLPWLDKAGGPLNRDYSPADYAKAVEGLNVERAVYVEVAVVPEQRLAEAEYAAALCERGDGKTAAAVIGGSP